MKVILLQDDKKLGKKGQIIEANDGFARNYILPKKIGVEATPKNLNDLKLQKANEKKVADELLAKAQELGFGIVVESESLNPSGPEEVKRCIEYLKSLD